jgi:hypothetical protein
MQITFALSGSETLAELRALALALDSLYGRLWQQALGEAAYKGSVIAIAGADLDAGQAVTVIADAEGTRVVPATFAPAGESDAPLAEPDPAALFTAGAGTSTTVPAVPPVSSATTAAPTLAPAPIAAAPAAPAPLVPAPPVPPAPGVDLDAEGIPWDGRIHASTKTKTAKGVWKTLRGLNDEGKVNRVKAELRAALGAPRGGPVVDTAPAPAVPQPPAAAGAGTVPPVPGAVPAVPGVPPVAAAPAPNGEAETVTTFPQVMKKISGLRVGQFPRMTQDELTEILALSGLPSLPSLATRVDLIPDVNANIDALMLTKLQ